jgi:hypothetical protein
MLSDEQKTKLEGITECELYFTIDAIGGFLWRTGHDISHGRYEMTEELREDIESLNEQQQYCLQQLTKFGINPESAKDRPNGDYWKWYGHWDDWKKEMDNNTWRIFEVKMSKGQDYSEMLPKHSWNEITK